MSVADFSFFLVFPRRFIRFFHMYHRHVALLEDLNQMSDRLFNQTVRVSEKKGQTFVSFLKTCERCNNKSLSLCLFSMFKFAYGIRSTAKTAAQEVLDHEAQDIRNSTSNLINTSAPNITRLSRSPGRQYRTLGEERQSSRSPLPPEKRRSSKEGRSVIGRLHGNESHLKQKIQVKRR